jgi:RecB family endonuclease NucS
MPTAVKIWEIVKDSLRPVTGDSFAKNYLEKQLESWVAEDPNILGDRVLIIGQQKYIPGVGQLDLLGIDQNGNLIIIELKRDRTPREAVAQALDYASWLHTASDVLIKEWAEGCLTVLGKSVNGFCPAACNTV